jgi:hypothetical protein
MIKIKYFHWSLIVCLIIAGCFGDDQNSNNFSVSSLYGNWIALEDSLNNYKDLRGKKITLSLYEDGTFMSFNFPLYINGNCIGTWRYYEYIGVSLYTENTSGSVQLCIDGQKLIHPLGMQLSAPSGLTFKKMSNINREDEEKLSAIKESMKRNPVFDEWAKRLQNDDPITRRQAALKLALLEADGYTEEIAKLLKDPDSGVRAEVIDALAQLRARSYIVSIAEHLKDENAIVRKKALSALRTFNAREYSKDIQNMIKDNDLEVRKVASDILEKWK